MRRLFSILAAVILTASVFAQAPEKMSYQAVIRDAGDNLVTEQAVGMRIQILQGSEFGTAVYVETQTPTTNTNGLVSIEIGNGTVVSGNFTTIDWANGPYFIKTETDPTGGTTFSITGISQLLSVPYALHAKTAETVIGSVTETDPVFTGSQANNITATDIASLGNLSGVNTGDQDISGIAINAQAIQDTASQIRADIPDVSGFLTSETDPVFTNSQAANITATDIANLGNLSGVNTGDQDISGIAINTQSIQDTASQIRADIPDVSAFLTSETDPVFTNSQAANITTTDITNLGNLSGTNTGDQDLSTLATKTALSDSATQVRSEIPDVSGFLSTESDPIFVADSSNLKTAIRINMQAIQDTANQIRADILTISPYSIGDFAQGGVVFWVDETGQHGLVCAKEDQSTGIRWYAGTSCVTRATGDGLFAGELNTSIIISSQVALGDDGGDYAAQICNDLQITEGGITYGDWYLPSKAELNLMYTNKATIDATATANSGSSFASVAYYWSSTESSGVLASKQYFVSGGQSDGNKLTTYRVRAIRAF